MTNSPGLVSESCHESTFNVIIQNVKKRDIFSIEKKYGAFNRGILVRFLRNILHLKKKHYFFHNFNIFIEVITHDCVFIFQR
jgi:hypothetical protein